MNTSNQHHQADLEALSTILPQKPTRITYEKHDDLKEFYEAKCGLVELKFNKLFLNHIENVYIDEILKNERRFRDERFHEYVNIIFGLVLGKRTMIVK